MKSICVHVSFLLGIGLSDNTPARFVGEDYENMNRKNQTREMVDKLLIKAF